MQRTPVNQSLSNWYSRPRQISIVNPDPYGQRHYEKIIHYDHCITYLAEIIIKRQEHNFKKYEINFDPDACYEIAKDLLNNGLIRTENICIL